MQTEDIANRLLIPLWRCLPKAYKMKYARTIWDQFEAQIKNAASTSDKARFMTLFCQRMQCTLLTDDVADTAVFLAEADGRQLLKSLREETTYLVLLVRVANEQRKEEWARQKEEEENTPNGNDTL
jgi:hypothetical protein